MTKALIVYASMTGNTEECVEVVEEALEDLGVEVDVEESVDADPLDFEDYDICLVATYTYGPDGNLPDEILDFYEELEDIDLSGKVYGCFGSGDTFYTGKYCQSVIDFDLQFQKTGAIKGSENVFVQLNPDEDAIADLEKFSQEVLDAVQA